MLRTFTSARRRKQYSPDRIASTDTAEVFPKTTRSVLNNFPYSQDRLLVVDWGLKIPIVHTIQKSRWNFNKANWEKFSKEFTRPNNKMDSTRHWSF